MNKDVLLTIYKIVHRDLTKQLNAEYHKGLGQCTTCNNVCKCHITIKYDHNLYAKFYNYRSYKYNMVHHVYTKYKIACCYLPKKYY